MLGRVGGREQGKEKAQSTRERGGGGGGIKEQSSPHN